MPQPARGCTHGLVGQSPEVQSVRRFIVKASRNRLPVLLLGESGTGKEVVAHGIHNANPHGQFVTIDCSTLVDTLVGSELFGHTKGSFSGAVENKKGLVEQADGGTAFFDEIGELKLEMQSKLLRLLEGSEFRAVGGLQWHKVDLRIIAATNRDLKAEVAAGRFREDLYHRLKVFSTHLPPLRNHRTDVPRLIDHFLDLARASGLPEFYPGPEMVETLTSYDWPGNVRELKNCVDSMSAMYSEGALQMPDLPSAILNHQAITRGLLNLSAMVDAEPETDPSDPPTFTLRPVTEVISIPDSNRQAIAKALAATKGVRGKAARLLGISRTTLFRKMKQYKFV